MMYTLIKKTWIHVTSNFKHHRKSIFPKPVEKMTREEIHQMMKNYTKEVK